MPKRTRSYDAWQLDRLSHPDASIAFLNAALNDSQEMFLVALRKVAQAHQMAKVAKEANVQRETLYRALSEQGNPTLDTLASVLRAVGMELRVESHKTRRTVSKTRPAVASCGSVTSVEASTFRSRQSLAASGSTSLIGSLGGPVYSNWASTTMCEPCFRHKTRITVETTALSIPSASVAGLIKEFALPLTPIVVGV